MESLETTPITLAQLQWTRNDRILSKVVDLVLHGWQFSDDKELKPSALARGTLSTCWLFTVGKLSRDTHSW